MKKILYAILTIFMLCMMNGCSKEDGFYVYTVETTEFDQYAKETIGSYIYANYQEQSDSIKLGKGILIYGDNTYPQVIYPIWQHNSIVATYQVIQINDTYMSSYSDEHVFYLNNFKNTTTSTLPLKIFKYDHELYYTIADTIYKSNGEEVDFDLNMISFNEGSIEDAKDTLGYLALQDYNTVKLYAYTKDTTELDAYAKEHFFGDLMFVNSSYELGRGISLDHRAEYPIWHNDSIVGTYSVGIDYEGEIYGIYTPYTFALNETIGKTSMDNPLKIFHQNELCYILGDKVYGTSTQKSVLKENFDLESVSFTGGKVINVRNTLRCKPLPNENSALYAYTQDTTKFDEYAKVSLEADLISHYKYINQSLDLGKGITVYGDTLPQVIYPLWRNNMVAGLYQVIEYDESYYSNYFTVGERLFSNAQNNNKLVKLYQLDNQLLYIAEDIVYEIDGIDVKRLFDFDINSLVFDDGEKVNVNEILEYKRIEY